jgi:hypothetical protein
MLILILVVIIVILGITSITKKPWMTLTSAILDADGVEIGVIGIDIGIK